MNIGVGKDNRQFHGSVANIKVFKEGNITEISAAPCKERQEGTLLAWNPRHWKVEGSHWVLIEEYEEIVCYPYKRYNLAISSEITLDESMNICKEKLNNSFIPYPKNHPIMMKYVAWHKNTTGGTCPYVWTPLSDENSEGLFLNMNDNSSVQYQMWDKGQPNGAENANYVAIAVQTVALDDVEENRLFCSTSSLSSSLLLRLDGLCEHSFIGNFLSKPGESF